MIVYQDEHTFTLIKQHDHGRLAGELVQLLQPGWIGTSRYLEEFQFAVSDHDHAWADLDEVPLWNDIAGKPYGVEDLPLLLRIPFYLRGLDKLANTSEYAALLVSMHYTTFQPGAMANMVGGFHERAMPFLEQVKKAQLESKKRLDLLEGEGARLLERHFNLFQLFDELSLYLCMQEPGTPKVQEKLPYKDGFQRAFSFLDGPALRPEWLSKDQLKLSPFPLQQPHKFSYISRTLDKKRISEIGLAPAYAEAPDKCQSFMVV